MKAVVVKSLTLPAWENKEESGHGVKFLMKMDNVLLGARIQTDISYGVK